MSLVAAFDPLMTKTDIAFISATKNGPPFAKGLAARRCATAGETGDGPAIKTFNGTKIVCIAESWTSVVKW